MLGGSVASPWSRGGNGGTPNAPPSTIKRSPGGIYGDRPSSTVLPGMWASGTTPTLPRGGQQISDPEHTSNYRVPDASGYEIPYYLARPDHPNRNLAYNPQSAGYAQSAGMFSILNSIYAPQRAADQFAYNQALGRVPLVGAQFDLSERGLRSDYALGMQDIANRRAGINIDRQGNQINLERLGLDREMIGVDRRSNSYDRDYFGRIRNIAEQLFGNESRRISFEGQQKARELESDAKVRGALFAPGYQYDQASNWLRTLNDMERRKFGWDREAAGLDRDIQGTHFTDERLGIKERGIGLSEREVRLANERLSLMASSLGTDEARLRSQLENGLAKLGLDRHISLNELLLGAARHTGGSWLSSLLNDALAAGVPPGDFYNLINSFN